VANAYQEGFRDGAAFFMGWIVGRLARGSKAEIAEAQAILANWYLYKAEFIDRLATRTPLATKAPRDA
jgi:hypothetical protein